MSTDVGCHKNKRRLKLNSELVTSETTTSNNEGQKTRFLDSCRESRSDDSQSSSDDNVTSSVGSEQSGSQQVDADTRFSRHRKEQHIHQLFHNGAGSAPIKCHYAEETKDYWMQQLLTKQTGPMLAKGTGIGSALERLRYVKISFKKRH